MRLEPAVVYRCRVEGMLRKKHEHDDRISLVKPRKGIESTVAQVVVCESGSFDAKEWSAAKYVKHSSDDVLDLI